MGTDRKTSLLRDRPARRAVKRAYRIWVSDAAHHCVQLRNDLLFTMSDNMHRVIKDRRDTRFRCMDEHLGSAAHWGSYRPSINRHPTQNLGGARRDRTDDLLLAKQALSQLSYGPEPQMPGSSLVGLDGFEPSTPALSRRCSNQLSYRPARPRS